MLGYDVLREIVRWRIVKDVSVRLASNEGHVRDLIDFLLVVTLLLQQRLRKNVVILKLVRLSDVPSVPTSLRQV